MVSRCLVSLSRKVSRLAKDLPDSSYSKLELLTFGLQGQKEWKVKWKLLHFGGIFASMIHSCIPREPEVMLS